MMKTKWTMVLAAVAALGLAGCAKENGGQPEVAKTDLTIKINSQQVKMRGIGDGVANGYKTPLADGKVLIFNDNNLVTSETLDVALAQGAGQVIENVPATAKVYVVGNIAESGAAFSLTGVSTWSDFEDVFAAVNTQQDASKTVLANTGNAPKAIENVDPSTGTASVTVNISPVVSRIQLGKVTGKTEDGLTDLNFAVTGAYVSNYYSNFTYVGGSQGDAPFTAFEDGETHGGLTVYQEETMVTAIGGVAQTASKVWGFNVAAGNVPYLIVKVKLLAAYTIGETNYTAGKELFLTVGGYKDQSDATIAAFDPGTIYNIANLSFNAGQLTEEPVENVALTLTVTVDEWAYVEVDGVIF
jgi:hypothetical protein